MKILAIETSCDETAIALVKVKNENGEVKFKILGNEISSQIELHKEFGGVFPSLAKREHIKNLPIVFEKILKQAKITEKNLKKEIKAIAVTTGPGLEPALWTGIVFAKELNKKYKIPLIPVNHMEGHIFSIFPKNKKTFKINLKKEIFPILSLLVSGGHTELVLVKNWHQYKKIGQTRDDASGEAFDKVARMLELPYPGGPEIGKLANEERFRELSKFSGPRKKGKEAVPDHKNSDNSLLLKLKKLNTKNYKLEPNFTLPRPMMYSKDYDFSFSGLKTAVLYLIRDLRLKYSKEELSTQGELTLNWKQKIAKEFEDAVVEVLVYKTIKAIKEYKIKTLIVGGGVSANSYLQKQINLEIKKLRKSDFLNVKVYFPTLALTGDNALMIAIAGYFQFQNKKVVKRISSLKAKGNLSL
jgi:N6-L-threonylcarbamoyladenine synthase